jgi:autotransporter translocation and assembly factor TamB
MSVVASTPGVEKSRWRRWLRRLAVGFVVLVAGLALAVWQHELWLEPWLVRRAVAYAREELGAELAIERLSLSLDGAELGGVRWRASTGALRVVQEAHVQLHTDWRAEFDGRAGRHWTLEGRGIELELGSDPASGGRARTLPDLGTFELAASDVRISGVTDASLRFERVTAEGELSHGELALRTAQVSAGENSASLSAARATLLATSRATFDSLRGELVLALEDVRALPDDPAGAWPVESAALKLVLAEGKTTLTGRVGLTSGQLIVEQGTLLHAGRGSWRELECELALSADLRDLAPFARFVGRPLAGRWSGAVNVSGPLEAPLGRFLGRGEKLLVGSLALDSAEVDLETDGERVSLTTCRATGPAFRGHLSGDLTLHPLALVDVTVAARADGPALATLLPFEARRGFVSATLNGPPAALDGTFEASLSGAEIAGTTLEDAEARGTFAGGEIRFDELSARGEGAELSAGGRLVRTADGWEAELERLTASLGDLACELERGARVRIGPGRAALEKLVLLSHSTSGTGRAELALTRDATSTRATLACERFDAGSVLSKTFLGGWHAGETSGNVVFERDENGERIDFDLALDASKHGEDAARLSCRTRGRSAGGRLVLERLELAATDEFQFSAQGDLPFERTAPLTRGAGPLALEFEFWSRDLALLRTLGLLATPPASGRTSGFARLEGEWTRLGGELQVACEDLVLDAAGRHAIDADLRLELGAALRAQLALGAPEGRLDVEGTLALGEDPLGPLAQPGSLLEAPIDLAADVALGDIGWIAELVPGLRRISGELAGRLTAQGTLQAPDFGGKLAWRSGELRLARFATPFRVLAGDFRLEQDVVHVETLTGEVGGAPLRVSGTLEPFGPFTRLDLAVQGENVLLARNSRVRLRADADLQLSGSPELLRIEGGLALTEGQYESEFDVLKEILSAGRGLRSSDGKPVAFARTGNFARAEFDVHVTSKEHFRYQTNLLTADLRADAWLRGTGAAPTAEGPVYVDAAELVLPSGKMELESGLLTFRREAPFRPEVALSAAMRVQRHDVRTTITGSLDELEITPSSTPPLADDDLWVLILTGQPPMERWQDRSSAAMESLAVFLARDQLVRWFAGDSEGLLDRFEVEVGARTTQSGQPTGRVLFYLKPRRIDSRRATYLSAEKDEHERVNYALGIVFRPR